MGFLARALMANQWKKIKKSDALRTASQKPIGGIMQIAAIPYLKTDNEMHSLNVYYPKHITGVLPTIIDIHGGGWMYGDRELNKNYCMYLASKGYAVVSMSYRLLPNTSLKGQVQDIFASLNWLYHNARSYHCDMKAVFLTGDSAGGHLALLTACIIQNEALQLAYDVKPVGFNLDAIALSHPVCDVYNLGFTRGFMGRELQREMIAMMLGYSEYSQSVKNKISFAQTCVGVTLPPVLLISSEADELHSQSLLLQKQLTELGIKHETLFHSLDNGGERLGHVFHIGYPDWTESETTNDITIQFFEKNNRLCI